MQKYSFEERQTHLKAWKSSGLSGQGYCRQHNIYPTTFYSWIKSEKKRNLKISVTTADFVKVPTIQKLEDSSSKITIEADRVKIHLPMAIEDDRLKLIITALSTANVH